MLDAIKEAGKNLSGELARTWEALSSGWRELYSRSSDALTSFTHAKREPQKEDSTWPVALPRWGLLAGELEETARDVVVRIEVPGVAKEDCRIVIEGKMLHLSGEKHFQREAFDSTYHVMERAYGCFQRSIQLPGDVDSEKAEASYQNGVLIVRLPKGGNEQTRTVPVK